MSFWVNFINLYVISLGTINLILIKLSCGGHFQPAMGEIMSPSLLGESESGYTKIRFIRFIVFLKRSQSVCFGSKRKCFKDQ